MGLRSIMMAAATTLVLISGFAVSAFGAPGSNDLCRLIKPGTQVTKATAMVHSLERDYLVNIYQIPNLNSVRNICKLIPDKSGSLLFQQFDFGAGLGVTAEISPYSQSQSGDVTQKIEFRRLTFNTVTSSLYFDFPSKKILGFNIKRIDNDPKSLRPRLVFSLGQNARGDDIEDSTEIKTVEYAP